MTANDRFRFDGEEFELLRMSADWTIAETIEIEDFFDRDTEYLGRTRRYGAVLWVSVHRTRPDFTLAEAVQLPQGVAEMIPPTTVGQAVTAATDAALAEQGEDVVLTPTNADTEPAGQQP